MSLLIEKYRSIPFVVEAVQVSLDNMEDVAKWCGGEIVLEKRGGRLIQYIKVDVKHPLTERQTRAFLEDWVLKSETGFKTYSKRAFPGRFEKNSENVGYPDQQPLFESI